MSFIIFLSQTSAEANVYYGFCLSCIFLFRVARLPPFSVPVFYVPYFSARSLLSTFLISLIQNLRLNFDSSPLIRFAFHIFLLAFIPAVYSSRFNFLFPVLVFLGYISDCSHNSQAPVVSFATRSLGRSSFLSSLAIRFKRNCQVMWILKRCIPCGDEARAGRLAIRKQEVIFNGCYNLYVIRTTSSLASDNCVTTASAVCKNKIQRIIA